MRDKTRLSDVLLEIHRPSDTKSLVVVVPGIGTGAVSTWRVDTGAAWTTSLPLGGLPSPSIFHYDHHLLITDEALWAKVVDAGHALADALTRFLDKEDSMHDAPIVFFSHSLGGIIVKVCIVEALRRFTVHKRLARILAVSVAIAVPHSLSAEIVPEDLACIRSRQECAQSVAATHFTICQNLPGKWLSEHLQIEFGKASRRIQQQRAETSATARDVLSSEDQYSQPSGTSRTDDQADYAGDAHNQPPSRRDPRLPCRIIPSTRNLDFTGRQDVFDKIELALGSSAGTDANDVRVRSFALCGPGGIGKTQIANEYAFRRKTHYEAIFWLDASNIAALAEQFCRIAINLGLVLEGSADARDHYLAREHVKGWLAKPVRSYSRSDASPTQDVSWLMIFDDVKHPQALLDYWPTGSSSGSILVTSRDQQATTPGLYPMIKGIELGPLDLESSANLLLRLTWREDDTKEVELSRDLAAALGGLPLALVRMSAVSVAQEISFAEILRRLAAPDSVYKDALGSIWNFENLKHSGGLLDVMTFLDPGLISESLLKSGVGTCALSSYPRNLRQFHEACAELHRHSLVAEDVSGACLTLHRIIQDTARTKLLVDATRASEVFNAAVDLLWRQWPKTEPGFRHIVGNWSKCAALVSHAACIKEHFLAASEPLRAKWQESLDFAALLNELGWYFQERGKSDDALACFKIVQKNAAFIVGRATPIMGIEYVRRAKDLLAEAHGNIGGAATDLNDANVALLSYRTYHLMLQEEHLGQDKVMDARLTTSFYDVGLSYTMKGEYAIACKWLKEALREAGRIEGDFKKKSARSLALINLGLTHWLDGWYDQAQERLLTALQDREELFGPNDRQSMITGRALYCLGNVRQSLGDFHQSFLYHQRALVHFTDTVGEFHHRTGNSCYKVAEHYLRRNQYSQALVLLGQARKIFEGRPCYRGEAGRVLILQSQALERIG
ncbi:hypothetical protein KVT40_002847 [Elsinoe batatas]|uniref:DUF7779 domain-containing protein n=1 Tax=Elsinoe batatas TaxID=2601811 RepID=A0A8K0PHX7_9PEZI|nr:hypothetical protein KVT40_002847 [Elsinoe batatas]